MGLYNFQPRFVPFILSGQKKHTIRAIRKHPDAPGKTLHLYTGLRTKKAKRFMKAQCVKIEEIAILEPLEPMGGVRVAIDGVELNDTEKDALARRDGFKSGFGEMVLFWRQPKNRLPFRGHIIHWK